jgi:2'-5' RNA ligase
MAETSRVRCFLALAFQEEDLAPVRTVQAALMERVGSARVKWVEPANLHLTLYFFGSLVEEELARARAVVQELAGRWEPIPAAWGELGVFPSRGRIQVIWLGFRQGGEAMRRLAGEVHARLRRAGFPPPDKPFRPHLTLGRVRRGQRVRWEELEGGGRGLTLEGPQPIMRSMVLYQSVLRPQGPLYKPLIEAPARGGED